jgi:hypothetical protein
MSKLPISKEQEAEAVARIWNMASHSLDPEHYEALESALVVLAYTRHIDYEVVQKHQIILSGKDTHESDCSTSDAPANLPGPCGCNPSP